MKYDDKKVDYYTYIKRVLTNTGPHGKHCGCDKKKDFSGYVGLGQCQCPAWPLDVG